MNDLIEETIRCVCVCDTGEVGHVNQRVLQVLESTNVERMNEFKGDIH